VGSEGVLLSARSTQTKGSVVRIRWSHRGQSGQNVVASNVQSHLTEIKDMDKKDSGCLHGTGNKWVILWHWHWNVGLASFLLMLVNNSAVTCITLTQLIHTGESDCTAARFVRYLCWPWLLHCLHLNYKHYCV